MSMQDLFVNQMLTMAKAAGFDPKVAQQQVRDAVNDIHEMKLSQDRIEAFVKEPTLSQFADYLLSADIGNVDRSMITFHIGQFRRHGFAYIQFPGDKS